MHLEFNFFPGNHELCQNLKVVQIKISNSFCKTTSKFCNTKWNFEKRLFTCNSCKDSADGSSQVSDTSLMLSEVSAKWVALQPWRTLGTVKIENEMHLGKNWINDVFQFEDIELFWKNAVAKSMRTWVNKSQQCKTLGLLGKCQQQAGYCSESRWLCCKLLPLHKVFVAFKGAW